MGESKRRGDSVPVPPDSREVASGNCSFGYSLAADRVQTPPERQRCLAQPGRLALRRP